MTVKDGIILAVGAIVVVFCLHGWMVSHARRGLNSPGYLAPDVAFSYAPRTIRTLAILALLLSGTGFAVAIIESLGVTRLAVQAPLLYGTVGIVIAVWHLAYGRVGLAGRVVTFCATILLWPWVVIRES